MCFWFLVLSLVVGSPLFATIKSLRSHPSLRTASVGVCVLDLKTKKVVQSHQPDLALIPASTLKAVTTATALRILGPDYRYPTRLYLKGDDLVILGGGDPTLANSAPDAEFPAWLAALRKAGMIEIKGNLVADTGRFEEQRAHKDWPWGDLGNYFGAGPSGLNFHQNSYHLTFELGKVGAPARLTNTVPTPPGLVFTNLLRTGSAGSGDQAWIYCAPGSDSATIRGTLPAGGAYTIRGALPRPAFTCLNLFRDYLKEKDFPVRGRLQIRRGISLDSAKLVHEQQSPPLSKIIRGTNFRSVNLYADTLFKSLTEGGTSAQARRTLIQHWKKAGVKTTGFRPLDGSGLSPRNLITPRQLAHITALAATGKHGLVFRNSLPTLGRTGTLAAYGKTGASAGKIHAKSGSLTGVRCYTGLFKDASGREFAFAVMTNNYLSSPLRPILSLFNHWVTSRL